MAKTLKEKIVEILKPQPPPWYLSLVRDVVEGLQEAVGPSYKVYSQPEIRGFSVYIKGEGWMNHVLNFKDLGDKVRVEGHTETVVLPKEEAETALLRALEGAAPLVYGCRILGHDTPGVDSKPSDS